MAGSDTPRYVAMNSPELSLPGYHFDKFIGMGSYATIYKATTLKEKDNEAVAIKVIDRSKLAKQDIDNLVNEIEILRELKHPNIVRMKDYQWDSKNVYIIMEYCEGGDLSVFIRKRQRLPERVCIKFLKQLATGLFYLRSYNISHFDLKPKNLLLKMKPRITLKIADFGFAQCLSDEVKVLVMKGSPLYMAPEMLQRKPCDAKVDLWSVGIIFYECLFGEPPFASKSFEELAAMFAQKIAVKIPQQGISCSARSLLCGLLEYSPEQRMDFDVFFGHPLVDVAHLPSARTYAHGVRLAAEAVRLDEQRQLGKARDFYIDALTYLVPHVDVQLDPEKKAALKARLKQYLERAEALLPSLNHPPVDTARKSNQILLAAMCKSTPVLADALDTMTTAEMYLAEGYYVVAYNKYEYALNVLIDALGKEPPGHRRQLLHYHVNAWLDQASKARAFLDLSEEAAQSEAELLNDKDVAKMCSLQ